jgi:hypothetical protein
MSDDNGIEVSVDLHCEKCGSSNISMPDLDADNDAPLTCNDCGEDLGSIGELREEVHKQMMDRSAQALRDGLKDIPGFSPKH